MWYSGKLAVCCSDNICIPRIIYFMISLCIIIRIHNQWESQRPWLWPIYYCVASNSLYQNVYRELWRPSIIMPSCHPYSLHNFKNKTTADIIKGCLRTRGTKINGVCHNSSHPFQSSMGKWIDTILDFPCLYVRPSSVLPWLTSASGLNREFLWLDFKTSLVYISHG